MVLLSLQGFCLTAGRKNLVSCVQYIDYKTEQELSAASMDLKKEFPELNRNLYPQIEPYSTGFLKVSDLHSIYWEQSGNPNGHVRSVTQLFLVLIVWCVHSNCFFATQFVIYFSASVDNMTFIYTSQGSCKYSECQIKSIYRVSIPLKACKRKEVWF